MKLEEIKEAVRNGKNVKHQNELYDVVLSHYKNGEENWLIVCKANKYAIGLTWADGVTLNGKEEEFYIY